MISFTIGVTEMAHNILDDLEILTKRLGWLEDKLWYIPHPFGSPYKGENNDLKEKLGKRASEVGERIAHYEGESKKGSKSAATNLKNYKKQYKDLLSDAEKEHKKLITKVKERQAYSYEEWLKKKSWYKHNELLDAVKDKCKEAYDKEVAKSREDDQRGKLNSEKKGKDEQAKALNKELD